ncbi:hypothetical protein D3C80_1405060 [compost metagenome]
MPKFSCTVQLCKTCSVKARVSGCRRWPPDWITRTLSRLKDSTRGSFIHMISRAGTTWIWVTLKRSIKANTSSARVLACSTTLAPQSMKPCKPGHANGKLWAMGNTSSNTECSSMPVYREASRELQA